MITRLAEGFEFPEAPTWFRGQVAVSDVVGGGVSLIDTEGNVVQRLVEGRRGIGGAAATRDGRLLVSGRDLVDAESGTAVASRPPGSTGLNDVGVDLEGRLFVGVLNYRPLAGDPPVPGSVARLSVDGAEWSWFGSLTWPNGIGVLSDGTMVVADYATGELHTIAPDGTVAIVATSDSGAFDGLAVDSEDGIWVATGPGGTVEHRERDGSLSEMIDVPAGFVSSICFSGADPHLLVITAADCSLTSDQRGAVLTASVATAGGTPPLANIGTW